MAATSRTQDYEQTVEDVEASLGVLPGFLEALSEQDLVNEWPNFKRHTLEENEIPPKYRELMGLAVAANLKCPYCQLFHREAAKLHGATDAEIAEIVMLASITSRYSSILHAQHYDMERFESEVEAIGAHLQEQLAADD